MKERPSSLERAHTPYFWPNFLYRVKVHSNKRPSWSKLCKLSGVHAMYVYLRQETLHNTSTKTITRQLCVDRRSYCSAHHKVHHVCDMVPFKVLCAARTRL